MKLPRPIIFFGALATVVMVVVVGGALLLPRLIDSRLIRDKISAELQRKSQGRITFGKVAFLWLPRPHVVIESAELSFADKTQGSIRSVTIYPSIVYLFAGRVVVRRALLQAPKITIRLPDSSAKLFDLDELEKQIRAALVKFNGEEPAPNVDVSEGSADIRFGDRSPVVLENVAVHTVSSAAALRFELSARSNLWERFAAEGKISPETLTSQLDISVQRLKIRETLNHLPLQYSEYARQGEASFSVKIAALGLRKLKAAIDGGIGPLVFTRHGGTATVEAKRLKAGVTYETGALQVDVERLDLGAPRLQASGQLKIQSGQFSTRMQVRDADIAQLSDLARRIAEDREVVRIAQRYISAGTIPEITIQSAGASFAELLSSRNLHVSGSLRAGKIFIPGADLELNNVTGSAQFSNGILEADGVGANLGTTKGWNGKLKIGLEDKSGPFHLDVSLEAGAPEVHAALLKFVHDDAFRDQLLKLENVHGELSGRLILGERLDAISPILTISKADIRVNYAPIPFPIAIRGGRFSYDRSLIRLENAQASVGRSRFGELGVTYHRDGSRKMTVASQHASVNVRQTVTLLRGFKELTGHLTKIKSAGGQIELQKLILTGAYDEPAGWAVESTGSFSQLELQHADLPDRILLSSGNFIASRGQIVFADTAASMSDASFVSDGKFEYQRGRPLQLETSATGNIGAQMFQWLGRYIELPDDVKLRTPLTVAAKRFAWRMGGDISFDGQVTIAGGPELTLDVVRQPQRLTIQNLSIVDGGRRARMTMQHAKDKLDVTFTGELSEQTFDKLFAVFPTQPVSLQGDIQVSVLMSDPLSVSARGRLGGNHLSIPLGTDKALVDNFRLEADGDSVVIRSADIRWGESRFTASGRVASAKNPMRVDLDVAGERIDWQQIQRSLSREAGQRQANKSGAISIPAVEGTIRLKTDRFTHGSFNVSSLEASAAITPSEINVEINQGIACGISANGRLNFVGKEIGVDLQLTAADAALEPTTTCLTNQQNDVKGTYSMRARLAGRGEGGELWRSLNGNFEFSARDGEFVRSPGIDATFDYLNASGDYKVAFPDLNRETFPYRLIGVKGRIDRALLIADEVNVASASINMSGQGEVDLERKQVDGKGLVAVLKPVDDVLARIPGLSSLLGGSLVAIPIRVRGSLERPDITYLSPADVGAGLLNIPLRILGLPLGALRLFTPNADPQDTGTGK